MIKVSVLIWDEWNKLHISRHDITIHDIEEICHGKYQSIESYKGRIQVRGKILSRKQITVILSPENREGIKYGENIYYVITAFEEVK